MWVARCLTFGGGAIRVYGPVMHGDAGIDPCGCFPENSGSHS